MTWHISNSRRRYLFFLFVAFFWASLSIGVVPAFSQTPFGENTLDTAQDEQPAESSGVISNSGMSISYSIEGVSNLKSRSFAKLSAWNFPGALDLVGDPAAEVIKVSGSVDAQSTGSADADNQSYQFRIMIWGTSDSGRMNKVLVDKTTIRPFQESFSFEIPEPGKYSTLSFQVLFREDTGPGVPNAPSVNLTYSKRPDPKTEPAKWTGVTGSGSTGKTAVLVAAGLLAAAAVIRRGRKKPDKNKTAGYVLQVSRDTLTLASGDKDSVEVTAWKVAETGQTSLAAEALIEVVPPADVPALQVTPLQGKAKLVLVVALGDVKENREAVILLRASVAGSSFATQLKLKLGQYSVEFF